MPVCSSPARSLGVDLLELDQCMQFAFSSSQGLVIGCSIPTSSSSFWFFSGQIDFDFPLLNNRHQYHHALADHQLARSKLKAIAERTPITHIIAPIIICTKLHSCATSQAPNYGASSTVSGSRIRHLYLLAYLQIINS